MWDWETAVCTSVPGVNGVAIRNGRLPQAANDVQQIDQQLQTGQAPTEKARQLEGELAEARERLLVAEAELAEEQAAVNAFRLHCRLTLGPWVDSLLDLRSEKQSHLIQYQLLCQELDIEEPTEPENHKTDPGDADQNVPHYFDVNAIADEFAAAENDRQAEKRIYRELARRFHPDLASGSLEQAYRTSIMASVNIAYQQRDLGTLRDLAGELDPAMMAEIDNSETMQIRTLWKRLLSCQRRRRKVALQLKSLRRENTAKLWRHAQELEASGEQNWWAEVQQSLEQEIERLQGEVIDLQAQIVLLEAQRAAVDENED